MTLNMTQHGPNGVAGQGMQQAQSGAYDSQAKGVVRLQQTMVLARPSTTKHRQHSQMLSWLVLAPAAHSITRTGTERCLSVRVYTREMVNRLCENAVMAAGTSVGCGRGHACE